MASAASATRLEARSIVPIAGLEAAAHAAAAGSTLTAAWTVGSGGSGTAVTEAPGAGAAAGLRAARTDAMKAGAPAVAAASQAYADGDEAALCRILDGEAARPEATNGDETGARLARVLRQIAQVRARFTELVALRAALEADPLWELFDAVRVAGERGENPLEQVDIDLRRRIGSARAQLAAFRTAARS